MIDWAVLTRLLPELALVIVFIYFDLERDRRQMQKDERQSKEWREFLTTQQNQNGVALARLAEEIKGNTIALNELSTRVAAHEATRAQAGSHQ